MKIEDAINAVISAGTVVPDGAAAAMELGQVLGTPFTSYPTTQGHLFFRGEGHATLQAALDTFLIQERLGETLDRKEVQDQLIDYIDQRFLTKAKVDKATAKAFVDQLQRYPAVEYSVYRDIFGGSMADKAAKIVLGPFTILHYPTHRDTILSPDKPLHNLVDNNGFRYIIGVTVIARTSARAREKADELFGQFEHLLGFMTGRIEHVEVGILNYRGISTRRSITVANRQLMSTNDANVGAIQPFQFDLPGLASPRACNVWNLLLPGRYLTDLQARILRAVHWMGEAARESSIQSAFLKGAIAIELLLVEKDNSTITASITARLADTLAMLLGKNADGRLDIEKRAKSLYGIRSAVAHSGKSSVSWKDVHELFNLGRAAVFTLLEDETLSGMQTIEEVIMRFRRRKYSFDGFTEDDAQVQ